MTDIKTHIPTKSRLVNSVLFVCNFNAVRSPMAEFIAKHICGGNIRINSVGTHGDLGEVNPFTISAMNEIGMDISKHTPKHINDLDNGSYELIVTLSPQAHQWVLEYNKEHPVLIENWPTIDPTQSRGNRENIIAAYRSVRDGLEEKIRDRFLNISVAKGQSD